MKRIASCQITLIFCFLLFCKTAVGQTAGTAKSTLNLSGTINANNNGFSVFETAGEN